MTRREYTCSTLQSPKDRFQERKRVLRSQHEADRVSRDHKEDIEDPTDGTSMSIPRLVAILGFWQDSHGDILWQDK